MKISTKGRYAVNIMLDMAVNNTGDYITLKTIAERQELSEKYLEQIIAILNRAGFVRSIRGAQGGYKLAKNPEHYTLGMILRLMEGSLAPVTGLDDGEEEALKHKSCATMIAWKRLSIAINEVVDGITLAEMAQWQTADNNIRN